MKKTNLSLDKNLDQDVNRLDAPTSRLKLVQVAPDETVSIAVVDDDDATLLYLSEFFSRHGFRVATFSSPEEFLNYVTQATPLSGAGNPGSKFPYDLVFSDVKMPKMNGIQLTKKIHERFPAVPVVLLTAYADVQDAVEGMKEGAYDYVEKPFSLDRIESIIRNALWHRRLHAENISIKGQGYIPLKFSGVLCDSPAMKVIFEWITRSYPTETNVLITGEYGVGKKTVAQAIHDNSRRADRPMISIDCCAIPEKQLEAELFGGAKRGVIEEAQGGTLFLDEVGALSLSLQGRLLRIIQERRFRSFDGGAYRDLNLRIICATRRNLMHEVQNQRFREDLYYQLATMSIHVPPLRQRREDILPLLRFFLDKYSNAMGKTIKNFTPAALAKIAQRPLKGNVRELREWVERSVVMVHGDQIDEYDLPVMPESPAEQSYQVAGDLDSDFPTLREVENRYIQSVLAHYKGKKEMAAKTLGLSRRTLYRRLTHQSPIREADRS